MVIDTGFDLLKSKTMADREAKLLTRDEEEIKEPKEYVVILLNDNYTTQEFVVDILIAVFHKNPEEANLIMHNVHHKGRGAVGFYTWDIAQTKVKQVHTIARQYEYPLKCIVEEA
jgi:ATP-dependent Clp protease adaptor protein ClpS